MKVRKRFSFPIVIVLLFSLLTTSSVSIWLIERFSDSDTPEFVAPTTTTSTAPPPTTVPKQEPFAALATVLPETLDGYQVDTGAKATGSLDLNAAVAAEPDQAAERALLETRHFEAGYARSFTNGATDVYMTVYDFKGAADAKFYAADGVINLTGKGASIYDIPDIPGAQGFSQGTNADSKPAVIHGVVFPKADRFVLVFTRSAASSTPAQVKELATSLYARA